MVDYVDNPKEELAQGMVEGVLRLYRVVWRVGQVCLVELESEDEDRLRSVGVEGLGQGMLLAMGTVSLASVVF